MYVCDNAMNTRRWIDVESYLEFVIRDVCVCVCVWIYIYIDIYIQHFHLQNPTFNF